MNKVLNFVIFLQAGILSYHTYVCVSVGNTLLKNNYIGKHNTLWETIKTIHVNGNGTGNVTAIQTLRTTE